MNARQVGPLMGIVFVVLVVLCFVIGGETPDVDDSTRDVVDFYNDNDSETQIASALLALAGAAFLFFLGSLRRTLRAAAGDEGGLSTVTLVGGVMIVVGASIFAGIGFTLGDAVDDLPPDAVMALNAMNSDMFFPVAVGVAVFNLGLGLAVLRHGGLPRPLGWLAIVLGIVGLTPLGWFAFLATGIVVIWASVVLMQQASATPGSATPAAAPPPAV